jgi:outer membrane protein TolC
MAAEHPAEAPRVTSLASPARLIAAAILLAATRAEALQPLETFLRGAAATGPENREARANASSQRAQAQAALGRLLPGVSLRGSYTRNEYESTVAFPNGDGASRRVTITPREQLDGTATLAVPLVDLANFARHASARRSAAAANEQARATGLDTEALVTQDYYQLVADLGLVEAARRALEVAETNLALTQERMRAGSAAGLEVDRARAEVERQVQQLAAAELDRELAARSLASGTGIAPALDAPVLLSDDLHEEPPLEAFQPPDREIPSLAAAIEVRRAQEAQARAQWLTLVPSLSASVSERATDATGFAGHELSYQGVVSLAWSFDLTTVANVRAQDALADAAAAREERARLAARDAIHRSWNTVRTGIARSRSARAQLDASARAAELARDRYSVGAATQLDLLQAQRDAFSAEAARVQADADLANARAQLRIAAGQSLLAPREKGTP